MKNKFLLLLLSIIITSCTTITSIGEVTSIKSNGYFTAERTAKVLISKNINLDQYKSLLIIPNSLFMRGMSNNILYFDTILSVEEFEREIILANKQDEVGSLVGQLGRNSAYRKFKQFLWLEFDVDEKREKYLQLKLIHPETLEELLKSEVYIGSNMTGRDDKFVFNPLFNTLVTYIRTNSNCYIDLLPKRQKEKYRTLSKKET